MLMWLARCGPHLAPQAYEAMRGSRVNLLCRGAWISDDLTRFTATGRGEVKTTVIGCLPPDTRPDSHSCWISLFIYSSPPHSSQSTLMRKHRRHFFTAQFEGSMLSIGWYKASIWAVTCERWGNSLGSLGKNEITLNFNDPCGEIGSLQKQGAN